MTSELLGKTSAAIALRDLRTIEEFRLVVALERAIWGGAYDDVVPTAILAVSVKRGGILVGAFDSGGQMVGFVYSLPGFKRGQPMQWSHMLGVTEPYRASGLGMALKRAQRDRTLAQGLELVEWTYDPLQAVNAHLNFRKLGVVVEDYAENIYGESGSPLHGSTPTDRFIASWYVAAPHVVRRLETRTTLELRAADVTEAVLLNRTYVDGGWLHTEPEFEIPAAATRLAVEIPMGYTEMLAHAPALAADWRATSRRIFISALERGYRVVDFHLDPRARRGRYLLAPKPVA